MVVEIRVDRTGEIVVFEVRDKATGRVIGTQPMRAGQAIAFAHVVAGHAKVAAVLERASSSAADRHAQRVAEALEFAETSP
ncbi:MAG TPA: hypothetical protein VN603_06780 [Candidatus Acidoferrales bacterium]|nr:hypothetical protein [Candidatus Acidoferrales bacterium]